jgi:hypothetical protein
MSLYRELRFLCSIKAFKKGRDYIEDDPRSGRTVSSANDQNVEVMRVMMAKDRRMSVRLISGEISLVKNAFHGILTDHLRMRKFFAKLVPPQKLCLVEQKANRFGNLSGFTGKARD